MEVGHEVGWDRQIAVVSRVVDAEETDGASRRGFVVVGSVEVAVERTVVAAVAGTVEPSGPAGRMPEARPVVAG